DLPIPSLDFTDSGPGSSDLGRCYNHGATTNQELPMSLYGMMRTGVSGMNAQANRLSAVADNIATASTVGCKRAGTRLSSVVLPSTGGQYKSCSVLSTVRCGVSVQGGMRSASATTDLAIAGNGYFV